MAQFQIEIPTFSASRIGANGNQTHRAILQQFETETKEWTYYIVEKGAVPESVWNELSAAISAIRADLTRGGTGYVGLANTPLLTQLPQ